MLATLPCDLIVRTLFIAALFAKFLAKLRFPVIVIPKQTTYSTYFGNSCDHYKTNQLKNFLRLQA